MPGPISHPTHHAVHTVWRAEAARIVAVVARLVRDVGLAEDLAQDALEAALRHWPRDGLPDNPAAWLTATAKHRALDHLRRAQVHARVVQAIGQDLDAQEAMVVPDFVDALDAARADRIGDDLLRLIFTACHPVLGPEARVALTLKMLGGLSTAEIARACLASEPTVAQRIVRAKRTLREAGVPFELPADALGGERLQSVLEVVYLIFNEGYTATSGPDWMRPDLCAEALRLGALLARLLPDQPEVLALDALMALQASRAAARTDAAGQPVLLMDQDRSRWDAALVARGLQGLARAQALGRSRAQALAQFQAQAQGQAQGQPQAQGGTQAETDGPYTLQAAIAACHARAARAADTDWPQIAALYARLAQVQPSPVVTLNRAVAVGRAEGPAAGLALADGLLAEPALARYPWLHSVRGDLLAQLGRRAQARDAFERAAALHANPREQALLRARAAGLAGDDSDASDRR